MPMPGWILYVAMTPPSSRRDSVEQVERDALEPQKVTLLTIVDADHQQRDLQFIAGLQHTMSSGRDVEAVVARRIVTARALVERPRARRWQLAMARAAVAIAMAEDREVARIVRIFPYRRRRICARIVQKGADEARAYQLRHPVHPNLRLLKVFRLGVDLDRGRDKASDRCLNADWYEERAAHIFIAESRNLEHV